MPPHALLNKDVNTDVVIHRTFLTFALPAVLLFEEMGANKLSLIRLYFFIMMASH
jgi:hypothetical protein